MLKSFLLRARRRVFLEWDAYQWGKRLKFFVSDQAAESRPKKVFLICDLMAMIGGAKTEAIFGGAMSFVGYKTSVLLNHPEPILEKIYRAAIREVNFVYFRDYLEAVDEIEVSKSVQLLLEEHEYSAQALLDYERDGVRVGKNALSLAIRQLRTGRLDLSRDLDLAVVKRALTVSLSATAAAREVVSDLTPEKALFNERGYSPAGEVFDTCLSTGCDAIQWFSAPSSKELIFKRYTLDNRTEHPLSLSRTTWKLAQEIEWGPEQEEAVVDRISSNYEDGAAYNRQNLQAGKKVLTRDEVVEVLGLDPAKKTAVIFTHILYDATFFYGDSLFDDYQHWLIETVRSAIRNPALNWVIKVHPVNVWRSKMDGAPLEQLELNALNAEFGKLPNHIRIMPADTQVNTISLYKVLDYGVTVRGTVGMELPCLGVPVITAGTGRYSGHGFTLDPEDRHAYACVLEELHAVDRLSEEEITAARRYYYVTIFLRSVNFSSFTIDYDANSYGLKDLGMDCQPTPDLRLNMDLKRLTEWIASDSKLDLLGVDQVNQ